MVLPRTDAGGLAAVAERIRGAVAGVGGDGIGLARRGRAWSRRRSAPRPSRPTATTAEEVLLAADRACFVAKRGGRGRVATASEGLALAGEFTLSEPDAGRPAERDRRLSRTGGGGRRRASPGRPSPLPHGCVTIGPRGGCQ